MTARLRRVRLLVLDVDGVLTDGRIFTDGLGNEINAFNVKDGHGIVLLREVNVRVAFLSGRRSPAARKRGEELRVPYIIQGAWQKVPALEGLLKEAGVQAGEICYMGDDLPDLPAMKMAGVSAAPADAMEEVRRAADIVTARRGGHGAVREICDLIRAAHGQ